MQYLAINSLFTAMQWLCVLIIEITEIGWASFHSTVNIEASEHLILQLIS